MNRESKFEVIRTLTAIFIAFLLAFIIILLVSEEPIHTFFMFTTGPFDSLRHVGNIVEAAIPLMFTGLAIAIMFKANQFNLAVEGAFFIGGVAATIAAINFKLPPVIHPMIAITFGAVAGAIVCLIPALLKVKFNASELVSSLMLNYIFFQIGIYIINYFLRDPYAGAMMSYKFQENAKLATLIPKTRIHMGLIISVVCIILMYLFQYKTKWGYALRMTGHNKNFAEYSGINTSFVIIYSQLLGGLIAGIGGATEILGMYNRFMWQALPQYGFDGVIVAIIARNNPLFIPLGAFFLAYLRIGADIMSRYSDVPSEMVAVIQAIVLVLIAAQGFLEKYRHKTILKEAKDYGKFS
ncbi:MAG: ABC-type uncharacterized transport system, permease component [Petrotoga mobilis]|nr:MAG: ABC-type uncharacterized transport system, permease component [Petrotoga mobilis]